MQDEEIIGLYFARSENAITETNINGCICTQIF